LPAQVVAAWKRERAELLAEAKASGGALKPAQQDRLDELFSSRVEQYLDAGYGACWLRQPEVAAFVADAIRHFDGERHRLAAWCVMPNHVHVVVEPLGHHRLPEFLKSWKGFSAAQANRLLKRQGEFWQEEYYDRVVRDENDFVRCVRYVLENPLQAGLVDWPWVWASEDARNRVARVS